MFYWDLIPKIVFVVSLIGVILCNIFHRIER